MDMKLMSLFSYPCTRIVVQTSSFLTRSHFLRKQPTFPSETRHYWFMNAIKKNIDAYFMLYKTLVIAYDHDANCRFQDFVDFEIFHSEHHRRCHSVLYTWHTIICTPMPGVQWFIEMVCQVYSVRHGKYILHDDYSKHM